MNLTELAKLANVSVSSVSKAFSGSEEISPETRNRIFEIAKENGCFDKYNKNKPFKKIIAVICPELNSEFYSGALNLLEKEIQKHNGIMTVSASNFSKEKIQELFTYYCFYCNIDGIIIISNNTKLENIHNIPAVSIGSTHQCPNIDSFNYDLFPAIFEAVEHLKENGHTRIGFISETLTSGKLTNFKQAMKKANLPINSDFIKISSLRFEDAGIEAMSSFLQQEIRPTAIITAYDNIAIGAIKTITNNKYSVPKDFSIIGMNDISIAKHTETALTTINFRLEDICKKAVDTIFKKIKNPYYKNKGISSFIPRLVVRNSTGPVPENNLFWKKNILI